jgi:hypothetical protein
MKKQAAQNVGIRTLNEFACQAVLDSSVLAKSMTGSKLPSYKRKAWYRVVDVNPGDVKLESRTRNKRSVLRWKDIKRVYSESNSELTPTDVDQILGNHNNWESSMMCALVLALRDPSRIRQST